jgi:hypothetical protein
MKRALSSRCAERIFDCGFQAGPGSFETENPRYRDDGRQKELRFSRYAILAAARISSGECISAFCSVGGAELRSRFRTGGSAA